MAGTKQRKLEIVIAGDARGALNAIGDVDQKAGRLGRGMRSALKVGAAGFTAVAAGGALAGKALFDIGSEFDQAFDTIRIGTGATGSALEGLKDDFRGVVADVPANFADAGTAVADLNTRLGLTGPRLEGVAERVLEATRLTGGDLPANIASVSRLMGDWSVRNGQMAGTLDEVFRASQASGAGIDTLASQVVQFGSPLRQMGFSLEESLALFGQFEREGVNIETVMAGMRMGLANMARAGEEPADALARVSEQIKNAGSIAEANRLSIETFGSRAGPDMAAAIREGRFELDEMVAAIENGDDTILRAGRDTEDFGEKWQRIKNRVFLALEPVATRVFEAVGEAMDELGPVVGRVGEWLGERLPQWIDRGQQAVDDLRPTFEAVVGWVRQTWPDVQRIIEDVLASISSVVSSVVETITAVWRMFGDDILRYVQRAWGPMQQTIRGALDVIQGVIRAALALIRGDWGEVWNGIKQALGGVWNIIVGTIRSGIAKVRLLLEVGLEIIGNIFQAAWRGIAGLFRRVWDGMVSALRGYVGIYRAVISGAWNAIRNVTSTVWGAIRRVINLALDGMKEGLRRAKGAFESIWNGIRNIFRAPVNAVLNVVVNPFLRFLDRVAGLVGLDVPHNFHLDRFHSGGIIPGRPGQEVPIMALAGEGVLSPETMRAIGPERFAELNKGPGALRGRALVEATDAAYGIGGLSFPPISPIITWAGHGTTSLTADIAATIDAALRGMRNALSRIGEAVPMGFLTRAFRVTGEPLREIIDLVGGEVRGKLMSQSLSDIVSVGKMIQAMGYSVGEHPAFGGVAPVHVPNSYHYRARALDINSYPASREGHALDQLYGWIQANVSPITELLWRVAGHHGHLHLAMADGGFGHVDRPTWFLAGEAGAEDFAFMPSSRGGLFGGSGAGGGDVYVFEFHGPVMAASEAELERLLVGALRRAKRKGLVAA